MSYFENELDANIQQWAEYYGIKFSAEEGIALRNCILMGQEMIETQDYAHRYKDLQR